jgi:hypothetical protein
MKQPQNKRTTGKEQYYTPAETSTHCLNTMLKFSPNKGQVWLEPAGGTGSFIEAFTSVGIKEKQILSFDIEPKHPLVRLTNNFLQEDISFLADCTTLTNPPFGRANKLAVPFFNKCAQVSNFVGFIVPKSWRKWSVIDRLDPNFHLVYDEDLSIDYVYDECAQSSSKGKLATIYQIWERRDHQREPVIVEDRKYIEKCSPEEADVSLTVFGRGCGSLLTEFPREPNTTKMFLKVADGSVIKALLCVDFERFFNNVAFVEALSIKEIRFLLNEYFDKEC